MNTLTESSPFGLGLMFALMFLIGVVVSLSRLPQRAKLVLYAALVFRVVGAVGRESIAADAVVYFKWGLVYAQYFSRLDLAPIFDPALWRGEWLGTNIVGYPAGLFITALGPTRFGVFLGFALLAFVGVVAYALAFRRAFPKTNYVRYWAWVFLFPSVWFWPSSIGKEAIMMLGLGIATLGYVGKGHRENWLLLALGLGIVFLIRAEVAAVFVLAVVLAHWLNFQDWSPGRLLQGSIILSVGLAGIWFALQSAGAGGVDVESIEGFVEKNAGNADTGGSAIGTVDVGPAGIPIAMMNVLFRPFLWEAHNVAALFSALELTFMWGLLWFRRRAFGAMLQVWRRHRVLRFALPFVLLYVVALGMNLSNLGLIARQRTLIFPLLFLLFEAGNAFVPLAPSRSRREPARLTPAAV